MKKTPKGPTRFKRDLENKKKSILKRPSLSYEDAPLENYEEEQITKDKIPKPVLRILLILLGCMMVILIWTNWSNLRPDKVASWVHDSMLGLGGGNGYPVDIVGSNVTDGNFKTMGNDIVTVSDTSFVVLNRSAKELCNRQHSFSAPVLSVDGNLSMIYNQGGRGLQIESISNQIFKTTYDNNIQTAAISNSGLYAVVTDSKSYLSEMTIYLKDNSEKFKYYFSEYHITDVSINSEGTLACATGITTKNGAIKSVVYLFDFNSQDPVLKLEYDRMFIDIEFLSNGNLAVVGDARATIIKPNNQNRIDYDYKNRNICSYDIDKDSGILLALSSSSDGRDCDIVLIDNSGAVKSQFNTKLKVSSTALKGDTLAFLSNANLYAYSPKGELFSQEKAGNDAKKVILLSNKESYILGISEFRKIAL